MVHISAFQIKHCHKWREDGWPVNQRIYRHSQHNNTGARIVSVVCIKYDLNFHQSNQINEVCFTLQHKYLTECVDQGPLMFEIIIQAF